ncbi:sensor histidine kinase [Scleromatobacter humisilvae]|uniref:histidine kinase n=1 Tax=Scleromatobacter humisilvae TaxID=2897159 RepID=A0A9X1YJX6_9BURK|nr:PAS domain-containing sensor histidine kinase [Scleromatobacter humisilvae]MCK9687704.1 PAS domain-containing sensor histidine kinase [Scleromatobacter humisilvae]
MSSPAPTLDQVRALAYAALLDHARRSDHAHALATLMRALASLTGAERWLWPQPPDGDLSMPPIHARPPVRGSVPPGAAETAWSCSHSGTVVGELRVPLPDGLGIDDWGDRLMPARDTAAALLAGLIEHAGHALPGSLALQRRAMHEAGTYVWEWDLSTDVLGDIDEGERLLGYPMNTLGHTQADWDRVIHPDDKAAVDKAFDAHVRGEEPMYRAVYRARAANDQWRWIEERGRIVEWDRRGRPTRMFGTQTDATLLRELEQAQRDRLAAEAANSAKTMFLSRISHELRTPLNAVLGFAQLLDTDPALAAMPAQRRQVRMIHEAGDHLLAMIGDLLDLSLAEAAHLPIHLQDVALAPLLESCVAWCRAQADSAHVSVHCEDPDAGAAPEHAAVVHADPTRLRQVLTNLLSNAVKYNRTGGSVTLRAQPADDEWHIEVQDTGHGISPADRARLFQPFNRLGREASGISGAGLGLALSQSLTQLMGGRITVQSKLGVGSIFRVSLPAA